MVLEYAPFEDKDKITDNTKHKKITQFWHLDSTNIYYRHCNQAGSV